MKEAYRDDVRLERDNVRPKDLKLTNPNITWRIEGNTIVLRSTSFAKYVFVDLQGYKGKLSDNYFDLQPGVEKRVEFEKKDLGVGNLVVKVKSLWEVVSK